MVRFTEFWLSTPRYQDAITLIIIHSLVLLPLHEANNDRSRRFGVLGQDGWMKGSGLAKSPGEVAFAWDVRDWRRESSTKDDCNGSWRVHMSCNHRDTTFV